CPCGRCALHRLDEEVDGRAVDAAPELRAHTTPADLHPLAHTPTPPRTPRGVDLPRRDRFQTLEDTAAVYIAVGLAPRDAVLARLNTRLNRIGYPRRKRCAGKAFIPTLPAAALP